MTSGTALADDWFENAYHGWIDMLPTSRSGSTAPVKYPKLARPCADLPTALPA